MEGKCGWSADGAPGRSWMEMAGGMEELGWKGGLGWWLDGGRKGVWLVSNRTAPPTAIPSNTVPHTIANKRKPIEPRYYNHDYARNLSTQSQLPRR